MRADQWFILAIGGIGVYAAIKLLTSKPSQTSTDNVPANQPNQPVTPPAPVGLQQNIIGRNAPPGSALLRTGQPYRGRLELAPSATREQTTSQLQALGFDTITVYASVAEARVNDAIPLPDALMNPTPGSRWFQAVWRGPSGARALPPQLLLLWPTVSAPSTGWYAPAAYPVFAG